MKKHNHCTKTIYLTESNGKATIKIVVDGHENFPVLLELAFRSGGISTIVMPKQVIDNAFLAKHEEYATFTKGNDTIKINSTIKN